jgi:hypothetical protein
VTDVERLDVTRFLEVTGFFDPSDRAPIKARISINRARRTGERVVIGPIFGMTIRKPL